MAQIVGGFASSHSPLMSLPARLWEVHAENDYRNRELVRPPDGQHMTYQELLAQADPKFAALATMEVYERRVENIQKGLDNLKSAFTSTAPDVVVMIGDDQDELFFEDNMPAINVFWGDKIKMLPRAIPETASEAQRVSTEAYGTVERDITVDSKLGLHIIESLMEQDFDVSHSRYLKEAYGGTVGPSTWYLDFQKTTKPRPFGLTHAFGYAVARWFGEKDVPIVPIAINTCYPPNWISPRRAYALGRAVRQAVLDWNSDARVAFACTGGLSHFVVDEELDRLALRGLSEANGEILTSLPRQRLQSATTETLNWVAVAGAMGDTRMDVVTYEPGYRTPAGTGCGCACGVWQ